MQHFVDQMSRTLDLSNRYIVARLKEAGVEGIVPSHGAILRELFDEEELPMNEIARRIGRDRSTVTTLVRKLEALGFARTRKDEADRRVTLVSLTGKGRDLRPAFESVSNGLRETQVRGLGEEELLVALRVLRQMEGSFRDVVGKSR